LAESVQQIPLPTPSRAGNIVGSRTLRRMLAASLIAISASSGLAPARRASAPGRSSRRRTGSILSLTGSAFFLGLDGFLQQLPIMLFTLIGGVLADRLDRGTLLLRSTSR